MRTWAIVMAGCLVAAGALAGCSARRAPSVDAGVLAAGDHEFTIRHGGRQRRYLVHVPGGGTAPHAVMLALHGGGGSGQQFKDDNGLDAVADRHGFVAVHPDGTGPLRERLLTWNAGTDCCGFARDRNIDDVGFLVAVLEDLAARTPIDRARVYVTGHSNGAMMAYRLAAERADLVAAVVPVAGAMIVDRFEPSRPVPVLHIHSVDDPRALYDGGLGPPFPGTDNRVMHRPVMAGIAAWASHNACAGDPVAGEVVAGSGADRGQTLVRLTWPGCRADVEHLRLTGVGHGWPGAAVAAAMRRLIGPGTTMINAGEAAWQFASQHAH